MCGQLQQPHPPVQWWQGWRMHVTVRVHFEKLTLGRMGGLRAVAAMQGAHQHCALYTSPTPPPLAPSTPNPTRHKMGRKARMKQGPPKPLPGSDMEKTKRAARKKKAPSTPAASAPFKAGAGKGPGGGRKPVRPRVKAVDRVDADSDVEDALQQG